MGELAREKSGIDMSLPKAGGWGWWVELGEVPPNPNDSMILIVLCQLSNGRGLCTCSRYQKRARHLETQLYNPLTWHMVPAL